MSDYLKLCKINDIPEGEGRTLECGEESIAVFKVDGQFHAITNTCPHRGGPLGEGSLDGAVVTCPWHGWQFDVTTGSSPVNPSARVPKFQVKVDGDDLYISK